MTLTLATKEIAGVQTLIWKEGDRMSIQAVVAPHTPLPETWDTETDEIMDVFVASRRQMVLQPPPETRPPTTPRQMVLQPPPETRPPTTPRPWWWTPQATTVFWSLLLLGLFALIGALS